MGVDVAGRSRRRSRWLSLLVRLAVLAGSLVGVLRLVDLSRLRGFMQNVPPGVMLLAIGIAVLGTYLTGLRWGLMNADSLGQISRWQYFRYMMISHTCNLFMPGALGGDMIRSVLVIQAVDRHRGVNLIAIIADRLVGLSSILILGAVACTFAPVLPERWKYLTMFLIVIAGFCLAVVLAASPRFNRGVKRILNQLGRIGEKGVLLLDSWQNALDYYRSNPRRVLFSLLICLPIHGSRFLAIYVLSFSIGVGVSFLTICIVTALVWIITAVPLTFAGLGIRELSFVYLLSLQGIPAESATALSLYQFGLTVFLGVLGIPFVLMGRFRSKEDPTGRVPPCRSK